MESNDEAPEAKWGLGPGPIVCTGGPASCQGYVVLINRTAEDVHPKAIAITGLELGSRQGTPPPAARVSARVGPYEHLRVPIELALDPATPPGNYKGQLSCGSQREDVVIHVLENRDLRIVPNRLTINASADETVALPVLIANLGNIEFTLPDSVSLHLEHDLEIGRHLDTALTAAGKQGFAKVLDRFVQELADSAVSAATVQFKPGGARVCAGETMQVELEIHFPANLQQRSFYRGMMKFWNARLTLDVECLGQPKATRRRQTRRRQR
jgi:hypothetical protein